MTFNRIVKTGTVIYKSGKYEILPIESGLYILRWLSGKSVFGLIQGSMARCIKYANETERKMKRIKKDNHV
jgi:hypothetical protein